MSKKNHTGYKTIRQERTGRLNPYISKHIIIVTDGKKTEINYIDGLKKTIAGLGIGIKIKQENTPKNLVKECLRLKNLDLNSDSELWIFFDCDNVPNFDGIIDLAKENNVKVAWSNPCVEIWFLAYFGEIPSYPQSQQCIAELKNVFYNMTGIAYRKNDDDIYRRLIEFGDETKAIERADNLMHKYCDNQIDKPSKMVPGTTVSELIKSIKN